MTVRNTYKKSDGKEIRYSLESSRECENVVVQTIKGDVEARYYRADGGKHGVIYVSGVAEGFFSPCRGLYPELCSELLSNGIGGLHIKSKFPVDLPAAIFDIMTCVSFLEEEGYQNIALVGHAFGGAAVIRAGTLSDSVKTVITLATQASGAEEAAYLHKPLLLIHGLLDDILPYTSSRYVYRLAHDPRHLVLLEKADHGLDGSSEEVRSLVRDWLMRNLCQQAL